MTRAYVAYVTGVAMVVATLLASAQAKPDFSGTWTLDKEKSTMPQMGGGPGGGRGGEMSAESITIKQTDAALTREAAVGDRTVTRVYKLDGSETVNASGRGEVKSKSRWDGGRLVTDSVRDVQGPNGPMTIETRETMSIDPGGNLVIESTSKTPMGERTSKLVYKKAT
jgi:hypothetical protein